MPKPFNFYGDISTNVDEANYNWIIKIGDLSQWFNQICYTI